MLLRTFIRAFGLFALLILAVSGTAAQSPDSEATPMTDEERCSLSGYRNKLVVDHPYSPEAVSQIVKVTPTYPATAMAASVQGIVRVRMLVDRQGTVREACPMGHPLLLAAAQKAAMQWKFPPLNIDPNAEYVVITLTFPFILEGGRGNGCPYERVTSLEPEAFQARVVYKVAPKFPGGCRCSGTVLVAVTVNSEGKVMDVKTGSGHPLLQAAVLDAVQQWRFEPLLENGVPACFSGELQFEF